MGSPGDFPPWMRELGEESGGQSLPLPQPHIAEAAGGPWRPAPALPAVWWGHSTQGERGWVFRTKPTRGWGLWLQELGQTHPGRLLAFSKVVSSKACFLFDSHREPLTGQDQDPRPRMGEQIRVRGGGWSGVQGAAGKNEILLRPPCHRIPSPQRGSQP